MDGVNQAIQKLSYIFHKRPRWILRFLTILLLSLCGVGGVQSAPSPDSHESTVTYVLFVDDSDSMDDYQDKLAAIFDSVIDLLLDYPCVKFKLAVAPLSAQQAHRPQFLPKKRPYLTRADFLSDREGSITELKRRVQIGADLDFDQEKMLDTMWSFAQLHFEALAAQEHVALIYISDSWDVVSRATPLTVWDDARKILTQPGQLSVHKIGFKIGETGEAQCIPDRNRSVANYDGLSTTMGIDGVIAAAHGVNASICQSDFTKSMTEVIEMTMEHLSCLKAF